MSVANITVNKTVYQTCAHTGMCTSVSLEVECVVETLAALCTQITFDIAVAFHVTVQQTLQWKSFVADATSELVLASLNA